MGLINLVHQPDFTTSNLKYVYKSNNTSTKQNQTKIKQQQNKSFLKEYSNYYLLYRTFFNKTKINISLFQIT